MTIDYEADRAEIGEATKQLALFSTLKAKRDHLVETISELENELKLQKADLRKLEEDDLVAILDEVGLDSLRTADGQEAKLREDLYMSIPKKNSGKVAAWLEQVGLEALISERVEVQFQRGEIEKAKEVFASLHDAGYPATMAETFNTTSVKAGVKELLMEGEDVPMELLGAYMRRWVKFSQVS